MNPHLSDSVNAAIAKSEQDGGICMNDILIPVGSTVIVQTKNSTYFIEKRSDGQYIKGGSHFPDFEKIHVNGSTFGGSMLKVDFIGIGMHMEVSRSGGRSLVTTAIQSVKVHHTEPTTTS